MKSAENTKIKEASSSFMKLIAFITLERHQLRSVFGNYSVVTGGGGVSASCRASGAADAAARSYGGKNAAGASRAAYAPANSIRKQ